MNDTTTGFSDGIELEGWTLLDKLLIELPPTHLDRRLYVSSIIQAPCRVGDKPVTVIIQVASGKVYYQKDAPGEPDSIPTGYELLFVLMAMGPPGNPEWK